MTKKEKLKLTMERLKTKKSAGIMLAMILPYSKNEDDIAETIVVPVEHFKEKWQYIDSAYDENLVMKNNSKIRIRNFL